VSKLVAFFDLFRKGSALADPGAVQNASLVAAFIVACATVASGFGYNLPMDQATAATIAAGVVAVAHIIITLISSKSVGLPAKSGDTTTPTAGSGTVEQSNATAGFPNLPGAD
jgi:hypothetical protein